jgi:hypothetical protein
MGGMGFGGCVGFWCFTYLIFIAMLPGPQS